MTGYTHRAVFSFRRLLEFVFIAMFLLIVFLRSQQNMTSEDTLYHIKNGEYILRHGIPTTDIYSFTAYGQTWRVHEWLWQVILYWLHHSLGEGSIVWLQSLIAMSLVGILFFVGIKKTPIWFVSIFIWAVALVEPQKTLIRPDIVSLELVLIMIMIFWKGLNKPWSLWILFLLQVFWVNIHGFFIFGPIIATIVLMAELIKRRCPLPWDWNETDKLNDIEFRRLALSFPIIILACLCNPQWADGATYFLTVLGSAGSQTKHLYSYVSELRKPDIFPNFMDLKDHFAFKFLLVFSTLSFVANFRKLDMKALILWVAFAVFSMSAWRNIIFFAPVAYLAIITNFSHVHFTNSLARSAFWRNVGYQAVNGILLAIIIFSSLFLHKQFIHRKYLNLNTQKLESSYGHFSETRFARRAVDFLVTNDIHGNFLNNLDMGLYLMYRAAPKIRVFFDGRVEIFSKKIYDDYLKITSEGDWDVFQEQEKIYDITGVFISHLNEPIPPHHFLKKLYKNPNWVLVYLDYDGIIFLKKTPMNQEAIEKFVLDPSTWKTIPTEEKFKKYSVLKKMHTNRAILLRELGFYDQAQREANEASKIEPDLGRIDSLKIQIKKMLKKLRG